MSILTTVLTTFTTTLAKELAEKISKEVIAMVKEVIDRLDKFKAIDERGRLLKEELAQARTDDEYKAILKKVSGYFNELSSR